jgi:hypothetical protein
MYYLEELALMGQLDTGRIGRIDGSARTSWATTPESFPRRSLARSPQPRDPLYPVCSEANHLYEVNAGGVHRAQTVVTFFLCFGKSSSTSRKRRNNWQSPTGS